MLVVEIFVVEIFVVEKLVVETFIFNEMGLDVSGLKDVMQLLE